jgi:hypothetical protein
VFRQNWPLLMEKRRASGGRERDALVMTRRGMTVRTLAGLRIGIALALTVLLGLAVPDIAHAQMLICASHSLNRDDANRLKIAARAVVPKSARVWVEGACLNPGGALGFVETRKVVTAEGVQQWWTLRCQRDAEDWECDAPGFKQFIATSIEAREQGKCSKSARTVRSRTGLSLRWGRSCLLSIEVAVTQSGNEDVGLAGIGAPPATDRHNTTSEVRA